MGDSTIDMAEQTDSLQIEVSDFGPIVNAKVDLRPFTVFVGPSNTGKSYLAVLIYALHRFFGRNGPLLRRRYGRSSPFLWSSGTPEISSESLDALLKLARSIRNDGKLPNDASIVLYPPIAETLRSELDRNGDALIGEISRCFGVGEIYSLTRRESTGKASVVARRRITPDSDPVEHILTFARRNNVLDTE